MVIPQGRDKEQLVAQLPFILQIESIGADIRCRKILCHPQVVLLPDLSGSARQTRAGCLLMTVFCPVGESVPAVGPVGILAFEHVCLILGMVEILPLSGNLFT